MTNTKIIEVFQRVHVWSAQVFIQILQQLRQNNMIFFVAKKYFHFEQHS